MLASFRFGRLGYLLSTVIIILIGGALFLTVREIRASTASVSHTLDVLMGVSSFNESVSRAEAAQRGLIISSADDFARDRDDSIRQARDHLVTLRGLVADNAGQAARLDAVSTLLDSRVEIMRKADASRRGERFADEHTIALSRQGMTVNDTITRAMAKVREDELRLLDQRQKSADAHYRRTDAVLVLCMLAALLILLPAYLGFRRESLARAHAEAQLRDLAENVPGAVFQYRLFPDGTSRYEFVSSAAGEVRGVVPAAAMSDPHSVLGTIDEADRDAVSRALSASAASRQPLEIDYRVTLPSHEERLIHTSARPRLEADGSVLWNGHWTDVTAQRRLERELVAARDDAQAASRAKGTFLATMSHEIRTPMNGVLGMLELLSLTKLDAEQRSTLNIVRESSTSLLRIIDDILDFSKIEAGKLDLKPEPTSIARLADRVRNVYSGNASSKGLLLTCSVDRDVPPASMVDPVRLQQVMSNLVSNAIKFTERGEVEIHVSLDRPGPEVDEISIVVRDTGIGIPPEQQAKLFAPFTQAESRSRRPGTGLGLSISLRLAEMMGGSLSLDSAQGKGTSVRLRLALPRATSAELEPEWSAPAELLPMRTPPTPSKAIEQRTYILVVDDHPINRMVLHRQLEALGYAAEVAVDGVDALSKFSPSRFSMVITDCHMPQMDGYELARRIRSLESTQRWPHTPIIACTANAMTGESEKCFAAGMDDYLAKPVDLRELSRKLDQWLPLSPEGAPAATAQPPDARDVFDPSLLEEACAGDRQTAIEILGAFSRHHQADATGLHEAVRTADFEAARRLAHRIKGAAAAVGAVALSKAAHEAESLPPDAGTAGWTDAVARIVRERERFESIAGHALGAVHARASA